MGQFKLQLGDYIVNVIQGKDPWSLLRKWAMGSPYPHISRYMGKVGIASGTAKPYITTVPMLFESNGRGVVLQSLSNRYGQEVVVMRLKCDFDRKRIPKIMDEAIKLASDPQAHYDYFCIVSHVLPRLILEKLHLPIPLSWQRDRRQICSEAALEIDLRAGVPTLPDNVVPLPGDFVTDSSLLKKVVFGTLSEELV